MMTEFNADLFVNALRKVLPDSDQFIGLHEPVFQAHEWDYVKECLDTGWVSSVGKYVDRFELELAEFTGVKRAVAVVNGTSALHICLLLAGVKQHDEVIIPSLTFIATANAVSYCNAVPHFVDSEEKTLGIDPHKLKDYLSDIAEIRNSECFNKQTGRRIRAVVPMHTFGHCIDLDALVEVCNEYNIELIEDAAESLGSYYKGRHTGNCGKLSALSFNGNKIMTTGGGGAILTNDEKLGKLAKHITTTAKVPARWKFAHDMVGYNYRMPNINAALGCAQLEQLPLFLEKKRKLAEKYHQVFKEFQGGSIFVEPDFSQSNYWLNVFMLDKKYADQRDVLLEATSNQKIMTRPVWTLMYKLSMYSNCPRMESPVAESIERRLINLPSSVFLA